MALRLVLPASGDHRDTARGHPDTAGGPGRPDDGAADRPVRGRRVRPGVPGVARFLQRGAGHGRCGRAADSATGPAARRPRSGRFRDPGCPGPCCRAGIPAPAPARRSTVEPAPTRHPRRTVDIRRSVAVPAGPPAAQHVSGQSARDDAHPVPGSPGLPRGTWSGGGSAGRRSIGPRTAMPHPDRADPLAGAAGHSATSSPGRLPSRQARWTARR